ncbi:MAG: hypothetical protein EOP09_12540, partial [Proteobacteria bacterium]
MDALVKATIEALCKKTLPELQEQLLLCVHSGLPLDDVDVLYNIGECRELLSLLLNASLKAVESGTSSFQDSVSALDSKHEHSKNISGTSATPRNIRASEDSKKEEAKNEEAPLSDEEAYALLAEMDNIGGESPALAASPKPAAPSDDMDEDEAMRLLAEMDAPAETPVAKPPVRLEAAAVTTEDRAEHSSESADDEGELVEIPEWEANEFQSDPSMLSDFVVNTDELMQTLDATILQLEQDPTNKGIIEEIFRSAHTLKGAAGMFGFKGIERVMHRMESLFDLIRKEKLVTDSRTIDVVFQGLDLLR